MPQKLTLPKFADWTPPWGEDPESIDPEKLAKYIHGLLSDKEKAQGREALLREEVAEAKAETEQVRTDLTAAAAKGADEKLVDANKRAEEAERKLQAATVERLKYEVALDEGLTKVQAKRLVGNTVEELQADAEELLESFGGSSKKDADEDDDADDDSAQVLSRTPKRKLINGGAGNEDVVDLTDDDINKAVARFGSGSFI